MDFSDEMADEILKIFQVESEEIISKLNNNLLSLEKTPNNKDTILLLFRDAHSLKGASRMVGFNNVQTLAHKMEDILGLAKEDKISLTSQIVDILYKTVDFISELIQKSINKGQEIYTDEITKHIELLENMESSTDSISPKENKQIDFNVELFSKNVEEVNNLFAENLCVLMQLEASNDEQSIKNLLSNVQALYVIFNQTGPYDIKKELEDIKVKLEFITRASNSLTGEEIEQFRQTIDNIIEKLISIYEIYNLEAIDYYDLAFKKLSQCSKEDAAQKVKVIVQEVQNEEFNTADEPFKFETLNKTENIEDTEEFEAYSVNDLACIQEQISAIWQNNSSLNEIKIFLTNFEKNYAPDEIKNIFEILIKILDYAQSNEIRIDEETASVLEKSVEYCSKFMKNESGLADKALILQQLEITRQVLEFKNQSTNGRTITTKATGGTKKLADFSEIFNTGEIKTLRVDSEKLDALVNQVNELTVTKIKTRKHLHELHEINNELEEWQRSSIKVLSYLKYYDKKYFQSENTDNSTISFIKQLLSLFTDNNKKVQEAVVNITNLQRTFQEDDMKMNLIIDNLENMIKNVRVLPLAMVFHLFGRMVRDIAQEKNKQIELEIIGSETTTDKKIIEEIKTPLIHIIRNAIDHGIETPEERTALGKNPAGKIILAARQVNNKVIIEIKDDGRGVNLAKIKEKALQKGFLTQEELDSMNDEQITNLIFAPGFSTGEEITNLSGRGIGLDVVQTKIAQLNGRVKVLSETNKGCCVQIELPTAMSLVKSFLVKSSNQLFAVPMEVIKTVLRKKEEEIIYTNNGKSIIFNDEKIPLHDLSDILNLPNVLSKEVKTILIIENNDRIIALTVDKLIGDQEVLHKKLSAPFYKLKNISGITTLDTGEICFILNISDILHTANNVHANLLSSKASHKQPNSSYKILLVDDSITTITLEKNILTKSGYALETAQNPIIAFEKMKSTRYDLIISDVEMPEMDGFTFLEKLKTDEMYSDIPVIMMSSLANEENHQKAVKLGAKTFLNKNQFDQDEFLDAVNKILDKT